MNIESLQTQIETLRTRATDLSGEDVQVTSQDYLTMIEFMEKMTGSAAEELYRTQLEIEAERQSYQNLFRFAPDSYFVTDLQGIIREANPSSAILLGIPENKLIGKALSSYVHAKERSAFSVQMLQLDKSKKAHQWETIFLHKPKQARNVAVTVSAIHDHQDTFTGLRWLVQDITEHHTVEERLHRSTGQSIESQQAGHVGSWEWDVGPNKVTWSDEMYRIFGLEPQSVEVTYESYLTSIHPDDKARMHTVIENSLKTHEPFSFDHRIIQPNGTIRYLHGHGIVLISPSNQPTRMVGIAQDITERKQSEEQLRRLNFELEQRVASRTHELHAANERLTSVVIERERNEESIQQLNRELNRRVAELQTILNVIPIGISVAYDPHLITLMTNAAGKQIMDASQDGNSPANDLTSEAQPYTVMRDGQEIPPEDGPLRYALTHNVFVRDAEIDIVFKEDGTRRHLLSYASPLYDEHNQVRGGVAAFVDVTKHKAAEKRLAVQYAVVRALTESRDIHEGSLKVLQAICAETGWEFGVFWAFDGDASKLYVEKMWSKTDLPFNELAEASAKLWLSPGEGLPGEVYQTNKPLWLSDLANQSSFLRRDAAIKSGLDNVFSFPIHRGTDEVLGAIEFFSYQVQSPSPDLLDMLDALGKQVGEFMGRKHDEDLSIVRMRQQTSLTQLSQVALMNGDLQQLLNEACGAIEQILSIDFCNVLELIAEKQQLLFRAGTGGWDENIIGQSHLDLEQDTHSAYIFSQNEPVNIVEILKETRFQPRPILSKHGIVSGLSVVVPGRSPSFGLLEVYGRKRRTFTMDEIHFLQGVAHVLAAAVQHQEVENELRFSRNQMSVILSGIADGITAQNKDGQLVYANDAAARLIGYTDAAELMSTPVERITSKFQIFDESGAPLSMSQLPGRLALNGESSLPMTIRFRVLETGEERWSIVQAQAVTNEQGQVSMAVNIFHDISKLKRAELGQRLLAETSRALSQDLDYETRLTNLATLLVPGFADWCAIDILDENEILQRVAVAHIDPQMVEWAHEIYKRYPPDPNNTASGAYKAVRTNQSEYIPVITQEMIDAIKDPDQRELVLKIGLSSYILMPLSARGHSLGVLSLIRSDTQNPFTTEDLTLAEELGRRAALALENARLYADAQDLNAELEERINKRTAQLEMANTHLINEANERKLAEQKVRHLNVELEERVVERTHQLEDTNQKLRHEIFERELADEALRSSLQKTRELYQISQSMGMVRTPNELLQVLLSSSYLASTIRSSIAVFDKAWQVDESALAFCSILTAWNKQPENLLYIGQKMTLVEYGLMEPYSHTGPLIITDIRQDPRVNVVMRKRLTG
ncbi:MAG: PAS domain S-box protein, partial [Chloroflexota bacterium]